MISGYINIGMFQENCPYALKREDGTSENGTISLKEIIDFCYNNKLEVLHIYGPKNYTTKIKESINKNLASKYSYNKCTILLEES